MGLGLSVLVCFSFIVLPIIIICFGRKNYVNKLYKRCTYRTEAVCVDRYTETKKIGYLWESNYITIYYTVWQFFINGVEYKARIQCQKNEYAQIGESSIIRVNPNDLSEGIKEKSQMDLNRQKEDKKVNIKVIIYFSIFVVITLLALLSFLIISVVY